MKLLLVTQKLPLPLEDGYNLRIHHYLRQLASRHEISLFALEQGELAPDLRALLHEVVTVPVRPLPLATGLRERALHAFSPDHLHDFDPAVERALVQCLARTAYDLLWVSGWKMLPYMRSVRSLPILGDIVDEGAQEAWIELWRSRNPRDLVHRLRQWWRQRAFEKRYFGLPDLCLFVAEADATATLRICPNLRTAVVHNGVDAEAFAPLTLAEEGPSLIFEGGMRHVPNVEGIVHFCHTAWPLIRAQVPGVKLWIVGKDPAPAVQALGAPDVIVTGFVADVRPYLARANVFISPLIGGAGIKNKILQAWAMGKAVVSTSISCGGLRAAHGQNLLVADGAEAFATACVRLLAAPLERERLGAAGRDTVHAHYTWEAKAREIEGHCEEILHRHRLASAVQLPAAERA